MPRSCSVTIYLDCRGSRSKFQGQTRWRGGNKLWKKERIDVRRHTTASGAHTTADGRHFRAREQGDDRTGGESRCGAAAGPLGAGAGCLTDRGSAMTYRKSEKRADAVRGSNFVSPPTYDNVSKWNENRRRKFLSGRAPLARSALEVTKLF